jgi:hypothetical protein
MPARFSTKTPFLFSLRALVGSGGRRLFMIAVHFNSDYARTVLDAIQTGKAIPPPPGAGP